MTTLGRAGHPPAYAAAAKAKLDRDRKSFESFRQVDQAEHERAHQLRTAAALKTAQDEVRLWGEDVAELEPDAVSALAAFRLAEDQAREAAEYARAQRVAYERFRDERRPGEWSAEGEVRLMILADSADSTSADAEEKRVQRLAELDQADKALAEARDGLATAERQLEAARKAAARPAGQAPISDATIRSNAAYLQRNEIWDSLDRTDKARVQHLAAARNLMSDQEWHAMMREVLTTAGGMA
jgi:hypothetical protein